MTEIPRPEPLLVDGRPLADDYEVVLAHEHLLIDIRCWHDATHAPTRHLADQPVSAANLEEVRTNPFSCRDNLVLDDRERIAHDLGTAVNVQAMVFGNRDDNSATGVGFTRNPATGEAKAYGDFLVNAQGEDVVSGVRTPLDLAEMATLMPAAHAELMETCPTYLEIVESQMTAQEAA